MKPISKLEEVIATTVALVIAGVFLFAYCRPQPHELPRAEQFSFDSLLVTKPHADSVRSAAAATEHAHVDTARHLVKRAATAERVADALTASADSLTTIARTTVDTAAKLQLLEHANDSLRLANDSLRRANAQLHAAHVHDSLALVDGADVKAREDSTRKARLENLNVRIADDVKHPRDGCTWGLGFFSCPSRTVVALGGLLGGIALDEGIRRIPHR